MRTLSLNIYHPSFVHNSQTSSKNVRCIARCPVHGIRLQIPLALARFVGGETADSGFDVEGVVRSSFVHAVMNVVGSSNGDDILEGVLKVEVGEE